MVLAWVFQGASFMDVINAMASGYAEPTGVEIVDTLVIRGGLNSMLGTIVMVLAAGVFGGPLKASGAVLAIIDKLSNTIKSERQLLISAIFLHTILFMVVISYYVSFIIIGNMMKDLYDRFGLDKRTCQGPWKIRVPPLHLVSRGAYQGLSTQRPSGVPVMEFVIFAPMTYLSVVFELIYSITGFKIAHAGDKQKKLKKDKDRKDSKKNRIN